jgi:hypothetical protein
MTFDPNGKNVAPMYFGTVHNGTITYRIATMERTPATAAVLPEHPDAAQFPSEQQGVSGIPAPQASYARVGKDGEGYRKNAPAGPVSIVLFGPKAAEVAASPEMQAETASAAIKGHEFKLLPIESDQNWGAASTALVQALMDDHALAILALDRDASNLAGQVALKSFVPLVTLSADKTLTSTNVPWIFLLQPGTTPATALRMLVAEECRSGANSEQLRNVLASDEGFSGVAFLPTGEPRGQKENRVPGFTKQ